MWGLLHANCNLERLKTCRWVNFGSYAWFLEERWKSDILAPEEQNHTIFGANTSRGCLWYPKGGQMVVYFFSRICRGIVVLKLHWKLIKFNLHITHSCWSKRGTCKGGSKLSLLQIDGSNLGELLRWMVILLKCQRTFHKKVSRAIFFAKHPKAFLWLCYELFFLLLHKLML